MALLKMEATVGGRISFRGVRKVVRTVAGLPLRAVKTVARLPQSVYYAVQGPRKGPTARFSAFLATHGHQPVRAIKLCRQPITGAISQLASLVSLGAWDRIRASLGYDKVYHNFLNIMFQNGDCYRVEKNHVVEHTAIGLSTFQDAGGEHVDIQIPSPAPTLAEMVARASASDPQRFWQYDARSAADTAGNCQRFTYDMLVANGLTGLASFLEPQDADSLVRSLGLLSGVPKQTTDLAGRLDRLVYGDSVGFSQAFRRRQLLRRGRVAPLL